MHLRSVEVKNFRCLKDLRVDLQAGLNVLVGRNNVGKTALLCAIRHALGPSASRGDALWLDIDDFWRDPTAAEATHAAVPPEILIVLTFENLNADEQAFFYEIVDFNHDNLAQSTAVVRFRATWHPARRQAIVRRTGGVDAPGAPEVPTTILSALPVTFLPALRDAEAYLTPGYRNRLAQMLRARASRRGAETANGIAQIFRDANSRLEQDTLITDSTSSLCDTVQRLAGTDYTAPTIRAADLEFDRILRNLQVRMTGAPVDSLEANGLGYNNLLYMAVVLEHLRAPADEERPLLLVEEPEAHLHPQLTRLLAEFLSTPEGEGRAPQTLVSTHSPTLVASVPVERVHVLYQESTTRQVRCNSLASVGLTPREARAVQRMMDVTRASMYFAKGVILVEGICEALLLPVLATRLERNLTSHHIAVIPICGVAFETFHKLLGPEAFGVPTAIVTDADPEVIRPPEGTWRDDTPKASGEGFEVCERTTSLLTRFADRANVRVFCSQVTLEYDLSEAGDENALCLAAAWKDCFAGTPRTLTAADVSVVGMTRQQKALRVWRGVCRASSTGSKAELAQNLSEILGEAAAWPSFVVPRYLREAIEHALSPLPTATITTPAPTASADSIANADG